MSQRKEWRVPQYTRPNILLLYTDQQRRDSLGCYGNPLARTPHLDGLAVEGVRFEHFYVQNPVCSPSRMSLLTGQYCSSVGVGLRYITPIGPMGLLYGHKLDPVDGESDGRFHLSIGYSF